MTDASAREFERHRPFLTGLAYRMLGSSADAQDIVQDAFVRWHGGNDDDVASPRAWLAKIVTRLCLDTMKSARARRESYVGPWLPDPIVERLEAPEPPSADDRVDAPIALMLALERLSPLERAAFILHDLFDMEFAEIAAALDRDEAACRQLVVRARGHVGLPGYVSIDPAGNVQTTALEIQDGKVVAVYIVRNPDKLAGAAGFVAEDAAPLPRSSP